MTRILGREDLEVARKMVTEFKKVGRTEGNFISSKGDAGVVFDYHDWTVFSKLLTPGNVESLILVAERELSQR